MYIDPQTTTINNLVKFEENQAKQSEVPMAHSTYLRQIIFLKIKNHNSGMTREKIVNKYTDP